MQGHFGADPHYMHWYNKYAWWYHVGHNNIQLASPDVKVVRIAYGIAGLLVKDRIGEGNAEVLRTIKIKFFDYGGDGELAMILEHLVGKVESARATEVPFHILSQKLPPSEFIMVVSGLAHPQPKEIYAAFQQFANEGGRIFFFNCASHILANIFPGKFQPCPPSTTVRSKLKILAEKELFSAFKYHDIVLEPHRNPLDIIDKTKSVTIITKINAQTVEPLFAKFSCGDGMIFCMSSKMFTTEKFMREGQKTLSSAQVEEILKSRGATSDTIVAWQCAVKVKYFNAFELALQATPSIEMVAKLLVRECAFMPSPPPGMQQVPEVQAEAKQDGAES